MKYDAYDIFLKTKNFEQLYEFFDRHYKKPSLTVHDTDGSTQIEQMSNDFTGSFLKKEDAVSVFFSVVSRLKHKRFILPIIRYLCDRYRNINKKTEIIKLENDPGVIIYRNHMVLDLTLKKQIKILEKKAVSSLISKHHQERK